MSEPGSLIRARSGRSAAPNFHSFVINELGKGIVSGKFPQGSVLPRDAELMDMYGVSRTVLREALKTLEAKGLVEARPKVGTRVAHRSHWALFDQQVLLWIFDAGFDTAFLASVFRLRVLLEKEAVIEAASHRTADDTRMMYYWVQQLSISRGVSESFALANLELHRIILEASRNPMLRATLAIIEFTIASAMPGTEFDNGTSAYYEHLVLVQRQLARAIETADEKGAEAALLQIIDTEKERAMENFAPIS